MLLPSAAAAEESPYVMREAHAEKEELGGGVGMDGKGGGFGDEGEREFSVLKRDPHGKR